MGSTGVLEDAEWVVKHAEHVRVEDDGVDGVARHIITLLPTSLDSKPSPLSPWSSNPLHPRVPDPEAAGDDEINAVLDWIFLVSVLNFSFWSDVASEQDRFGVRWPQTADGRRWTGYFSLLAALHRALDEGIPITTPEFYRTIDTATAQRVFRADGAADPIPLLDERISVMREAGQVLCERHGGHFASMITAAQGSAVALVNRVVDDLPSFRDEALYRGRRVRFYKRAQILVAETWAAFEGREPGRFDDIADLTMFADYRVPQILHSLGTVAYSPHLTAVLRSEASLPNGCDEEVEIRAASIVAVEAIRERIDALLISEGRAPRRRTPTAVELDFWLWDLAKAKEQEARERGASLLPHHRTRSHFY